MMTELIASPCEAPLSLCAMILKMPSSSSAPISRLISGSEKLHAQKARASARTFDT